MRCWAPLPRLAWLTALVAAATAACSGDHAGLAAGAGDAATQGADAADGARDGDADAASDAESDGADPSDAPVEAEAGPPPAPHLLVVQGFADAERARLCIVPWSGGHDQPGSVLPLPADAAGLGPGEALAVDAIAGVDLAHDDVHLLAFVSHLELLAGLSCADAIALAGSDAAVRPELRSLPWLPEGTLAGHGPVLVATSGCGAGHAEALAATACGPGYQAALGNATVLVALLSAEAPAGAVALQVALVPPGSAPLDVHLAPAGALPEQTLVDGLGPARLEPRPVGAAIARAAFGDPLDAAWITVRATGTTSELARFDVAGALARAGLAPADLADGRAFALVLAGAPPGLGAGGFWRPPTATLVRVGPG